MGSSTFQAFWISIRPQIKNILASNFIFMFEYNFRSASLLGLVGAGGIGQVLMMMIEWRQFSKAGVVLFLLFIIVIIIDFISEKIRNYFKLSREI
jgi:phosphonate transport system permease protein